MTVGSIPLAAETHFKLKAGPVRIVIILNGLKLLLKSYTSPSFELRPNQEVCLFTIQCATKEGIEIIHQRPILFLTAPSTIFLTLQAYYASPGQTEA